MSTRRRFWRALAGLATLAAAAPLACSDESVTAVDVATIEISPQEATLYPGEERQFSADARDGSGNTLAGRPMQWSSDDTDVASVDDAGLVTAQAPGTATITASSDQITGTAAVTVQDRSMIVLGATALSMEGKAGASSASAGSVDVTGEGGDVTDLSLSVGYPDGEPDGWLEAAFSDGNTSTPTTLLLQASPADLSEGSYQANVEVASTTAGNSPQVLEVAFEVVAQVSPEASPTTSTIDADPRAITADGSSTSVVTVTLRNAGGAALEQGGDEVTLETTAGTLSDEVTDNGDGTYTATLTSATAPATAVITGTVNGETIDDEATVEFAVGSASTATSTVEVAPDTIVADGDSTSTITVTLRDAEDNQLTGGGADVELGTTVGMLSDDTDNGDGTYTATLTSTAAGTATITATIAGETIEDDATVEITPGNASTATSTIEVAPDTIVADGDSTSTITVTLRDAQDNQLTEGGADVELGTSVGTLSDDTDNGDGTYTATLTSTTTGTATITATIGGEAIEKDATVEIVPDTVSTATSTIVADPDTIVADGSSTSMIRVAPRDAEENPLPQGAVDVELQLTPGNAGIISSPIADMPDGTYEAELTSSTMPGSAIITATVDGETIEDQDTVVFTVGGANAMHSTIEAHPPHLIPGTTSTIEVELFDAYDNPITADGDVVSLDVVMGPGILQDPIGESENGKYTSTFIPPLALAGSAIISGEVNGVPIADSAEVTFLFTPPSEGESTVNGNSGTTATDENASAAKVALPDTGGSTLTDEGAVSTDEDRSIAGTAESVSSEVTSTDGVPSELAPAGAIAPAAAEAADTAAGTEPPEGVPSSVISLSSRGRPAAEWNNG